MLSMMYIDFNRSLNIQILMLINYTEAKNVQKYGKFYLLLFFYMADEVKIITCRGKNIE